MCDSSSSSSASSTSKRSSGHSVLEDDLNEGLPGNKDDASLHPKSIEERTTKEDTSDDEGRESNPSQFISSGGLVRPKSKYTTNTRLVKRKLERLKAKMQKLSEKHQCIRPERKAYHPFVWNSLNPYTNTSEIDYLLKSSIDHGGDGRPTKNTRTQKVHLSH